MVIVWFHMIESSPYHTRTEVILIFSFAILAGIVWPLTLSVALVLMVICAIEDIMMALRDHNKNKQE